MAYGIAFESLPKPIRPVRPAWHQANVYSEPVTTLLASAMLPALS